VTTTPGRNAPCPCGSGRKYKNCCIDKDRGNGIPREAQRLYDRVNSLTASLTAHARRRFGDVWLERACETWFGGEFADDELAEEQDAFLSWALFEFGMGGTTVAADYLSERGNEVDLEDRRLIQEQLAACLSLWEVEDAQPGRGVALHDLLTDERRFVCDVNASRSMSRWMVVAARVLTVEELSVFDGVYPRPLSPRDAEPVVRYARERLRVRTRPMARERLRDAEVSADLICEWRDAIEGIANRPLPQLSNYDGDPLLLTTDYFMFQSGDRAAVLERVAGLEDAERDDESPTLSTIGLLRPTEHARGFDGRVSVASITIETTRMVITTNSTRRADDARARVEAVCGAMIRHEIRKHEDPRTMIAKSQVPHRLEPPSEIPPEIRSQILRGFKEKHYAGWPDDKLPAFGGRSAREMVETAAGRRKVLALLKQMEFGEQGLPEDERFDFERIGVELGLTKQPT